MPARNKVFEAPITTWELLNARDAGERAFHAGLPQGLRCYPKDEMCRAWANGWELARKGEGTLEPEQRTA